MESSEVVNENMEKIIEDAENIASNLLPDKSRDRYMRSYDKFMSWKNERKIDKECFSEAVMLVYFDSLKSSYKPSSIWCEYSMLKTVIQSHHNVAIKYEKLTSLLKKNSSGFQAKKSNVFEAEHIRRFLSEADDGHYLAAKVIMIFGIYGATRCDELTKVEMDHVRKQGKVFIIRIPETKTKIVRVFTVENEAEYIRKYLKLRPSNVAHNRFFVNYQKGKCTIQPIGRNKFLNTPKLIAEFLHLEDVKNYSGHSFRRTSATLLADGGADLLALKRHGGWKSTSVVEGYIEDSISNKRKIGAIISEQIKNGPATSTNTSSVPIESSISTSDVVNTSTSDEVIASTSNEERTTSSNRPSTAILSQSTFQQVTQIVESDKADVTENFFNAMGMAEKFVNKVKFDACEHVTFNINFNK